MQSSYVPTALRDRLGSEATVGLVEWADSSSNAWRDQTLHLAFERFDRRLAEECSAIRVEMAESQARIRVDVSKELHEGLAGVRTEIAAVRVDLIKWSFLFWIGQVAVMIGVISFMLSGIAR